jgi:hypothetical protein
MHEFQRLMNAAFGSPKNRPARHTRLVIVWDNDTVTEVYRRGREWIWDGNGSSHLCGIEDQLKYNRQRGELSGHLVRVPVSTPRSTIIAVANR